MKAVQHNLSTSAEEELVVLAARASAYGCRWLRFSEDIVARLEIVRPLELEQLKKDCSLLPLVVTFLNGESALNLQEQKKNSTWWSPT